MMRYSILILLVLYCVYIQAQHLEEGIQVNHANYVTQNDQNKPISLTMNIDENGDSNNLSDLNAYKSTEKPNNPKPTKKPGTYLQSIWDIYFP